MYKTYWIRYKHNSERYLYTIFNSFIRKQERLKISDLKFQIKDNKINQKNIEGNVDIDKNWRLSRWIQKLIK
jgi:hypothetical protein